MLRDLFSLFPAYAGVILTPIGGASVSLAFPRIRGGDPLRKFLVQFAFHFSPHTRG